MRGYRRDPRVPDFGQTRNASLLEEPGKTLALGGGGGLEW
jgi:hypothetical protein